MGGCGDGYFTKALLRERCPAKLVGVDISDNLLQIAQCNAHEVEFKFMDMHQLTFREVLFDTVVSHMVFHYSPNLRRLFRSVAHCMKPGGALYFVVYIFKQYVETAERLLWAKKCTASKFASATKNIIVHTEDEWLAAMLAVGFEQIPTERSESKSSDAMHVALVHRKGVRELCIISPCIFQAQLTGEHDC